MLAVHLDDIAYDQAWARAARPAGSSARPLIRPPDPAIRGTTLTYMAVPSHNAVRRLAHLALRDAHSVLDLTYAAGAFWRDPLPPDLTLTRNNLDPHADADLHVDFTATGLPASSYDLVVYDPPHIADGGPSSIMAARYGTVKGVPALRELIAGGAAEAWRLATVGIIVKVADHSHGSELLALTDWIKAAVPMAPYTVLHTLRPGYFHDGKRRVERVPRNNGATYLVFRRDGSTHRDFEQLYARQMSRLAVVAGRQKLCPMCDMPMPFGRRRDAEVCSVRCRKRAERNRRRQILSEAG